MVLINEGVPGSGKTYDAIRKIIDALRKGRIVYTNIDGLDKEECREYLSGFLSISRDALDALLIFMTPEQVRSFWTICPPGCFIVIDEAQLYFNSRDFAKESNRVFGDWASTHRHYGYDLLLITQRSARIDTSVRSLAEFKYRFRKLNVFGSLFKKGYLVYTFAGDDEKHLRIEKKTYDTSIFPAYNSYVGDSTEKNVQKNPNILNHPIFWAMGICLALMIYYLPQSQLFSGDLSAIATGRDPNSPISSKAVAVAPGAPGQATASSLSVSVSDSGQSGSADPSLSEWVTVPFQGYIEGNGKKIVLLGRRRITTFAYVDLVQKTVTLRRALLPPEMI